MTYIDRGWGPGPWDEEPDRVEWREYGLPCVILRHQEFGCLNGYVGVPPGHPYYKKGYDSVDLSVHGGVTFAGPSNERLFWYPERNDVNYEPWWFGFDCAHYNDLMPGTMALLRQIRGAKPDIPALSESYTELNIYRDMDYVRTEVNSLANQLIVVHSKAFLIN